MQSRVLNTALLAIPLLLIYSQAHGACEKQVQAPKKSPSKTTISEIIIIPNSIFEDDDEAIWLHHLLNKLHINTKPKVINSHLTFEQGDTVTEDDIKESERLLRNKSYLRDAVITLGNNCNKEGQQIATVNTWDNWTLLPKVSINRTGGENRYAVGLKDDNFLGRGIKSTFTYFSDEDRTGYGLIIRAPLTHYKHTNLGLTLFDNDDGYRYGIKLNKDFYSLNSKRSRFIETEQNKYNQTIRQNGDDINIFQSSEDFFDVGFGWSTGKQDGWVTRWKTGFRIDQYDFYDTVDDDDDLSTVIRPNNRDFVYPWLEYQLIQDSFKVISDVHFIGKKEDHHLGWRYKAQLGIEADNDHDEDDFAGHLRASINRGLQRDKHLLFVSSQASWDFGIQDNEFYKVGAGLEYFYDPGKKTIFYTKTEFTQTENNYIDRPITLGGDIDDEDDTLEFISAADSVVRGYPSQYQHGSKRWQMTGEIRHYPGIEIYRLARLAWACFFDAGRAWGDTGPVARNEESGVISSVGIGVRAASIRSSGRNIIHLDLAKPLTTGKEVKGWEIRLQAKHKF